MGIVIYVVTCQDCSEELVAAHQRDLATALDDHLFERHQERWRARVRSLLELAGGTP